MKLCAAKNIVVLLQDYKLNTRRACPQVEIARQISLHKIVARLYRRLVHGRLFLTVFFEESSLEC